jgi:hypothetical protein
MLRAGILVLAMVAVAWMYAHQGGEGFLSDDSYQYMDAGAMLAETGCLCTGAAHFDEQVAAGKFPVPFTHFPPGYPLLIAAAVRLGAPLETAALLFPLLAYLASVWLLWILATRLGAPPVMAAGACVLWIVHAAALATSAVAVTESLFTALLLALALAMVSRPSQRAMAACGVLAALAYWVRYAGLFVLPVAGLYLLWRAWKERTLRGSAICGLVAMTILTLSVMVRNAVLSGSWRGGFNGSARGLSPVSAVTGSIKAAYHLVFGDRAAAHLDFWMLLFAAGALYLGWRLLAKREWPQWREGHAWVGILAAIYTAGILAAAMQTIAADFNRYYLPLYPLALAVAASVLPRQYIALAAIVVAIAGVQSRSLLAPAGTARHKAAEKALLAEGDARSWILRQTGPGEVIFAGNGQALRYVLGRQRPVVSLISPEFTSRVDDEAGIRALMDRFHSRYLVLFPASGAAEAPEQSLNPFVSKLLSGAGTPPPAWLTVAFRTPQVLIFEKKK